MTTENTDNRSERRQQHKTDEQQINQEKSTQTETTNIGNQEVTAPALELSNKSDNPSNGSSQLPFELVGKETNTENHITIETDNGKFIAQKEDTIHTTSQGKQFIRIPLSHTTVAGFDQGDDVFISPVNFNGQLCFQLHQNENKGSIKRKLRKSYTAKEENALTLPNKLVTGARIGNAKISYRSVPGQITVFFNREPTIVEELTVRNPKDILMKKQSNNVYLYRIVNEQYEEITYGDSAIFWYDVFGDEFIFVVEIHPDKALVETGIEISIMDGPENANENRIYLPKQVCEAIGVNGEHMTWGHNSQRLIGRTKKYSTNETSPSAPDTS